ncbi:MAG: MBL fold metallo-hydrolase [Firmicutes bacterium]|nr:MBL fold metallo-hydrolase [Bacillota bacterium]
MAEQFKIRNTWRVKKMHQAPPPPKVLGPVPADDVEPTRIFDQLSIIGDTFVWCFVLETTEGLILIDCLYPYQKYVDMIEDGLKKLELDPANLKAILITHGHFDHYGSCDYFQKKYGTKIYMSGKEYYYYTHLPEDDDHEPLTFTPDGFLEDGDDFTLGDTTVHCVGTGGHSPSVLSFIFPVTDEGRPHMCCTWGGTGVPRKRDWQEQYLQSAIHFTEVCDEYKCDVEVSNHPIIDNGLERLNVIHHITEGVANPFVIGRDACHRYTRMFYDFCAGKMDPKPAPNPLSE